MRKSAAAIASEILREEAPDLSPLIDMEIVLLEEHYGAPWDQHSSAGAVVSAFLRDVLLERLRVNGVTERDCRNAASAIEVILANRDEVVRLAIRDYISGYFLEYCDFWDAFQHFAGPRMIRELENARAGRPMEAE